MKPTKEELESLLENEYTLKQISEHFGKKSANTARGWLASYGLEANRPTKAWTEEEDQFLIENYPSLGYEYCGEKLGRSKDSVYHRVKKIGVARNFNWQKLDRDFLEKEYPTKSISVIADENELKFWDVYAALINYGIEIDKSGKYFGKDHHNWAGYEEISGSHWRDIVRSCKSRGKNRVINFDITIKEAWKIFVTQGRRCALSGVEIHFSSTGANRYEKTTASLDRIDSSKGYSEGNCQWLHKQVNKIKMDVDQSEFLDWCRKITKEQGDKL